MSVADEATVVLPGRAIPVRIDIPQQTSVRASPEGTNGSNTMKIVFIVGLFGAMILIAVAGAAALLYYNKDSRSAPTNSNNVSPAPAASPTTDQTNALRDQIANLERRLSDQKKNGSEANGPTPPLNAATNAATMTTQARANSPGDGFLALRSLPNSEAGERIAKIPHGATVMVGTCGPIIKPVRRSGRWCQANYNGQTGWVFDAFLTY